MLVLARVFGLIAALAFACAGRAANEPRPVVGPGATKEDVINAYGWPNGQSQSGTKEILSYVQGEVVLDNGRVERVNFSPNVPWQTPRPRPGPATASTRKMPEVPVDFWLTSFADAQREAQRRHARILVLFTGSDWSPPSRKFHDEVEYNPDFVNAFAGDFVFLKLDYPRGNPVPVKISEENLQLRDRYNVTTYPTLVVLSAAGDLLAAADISRLAGAEGFRERVTATVRDLRAGTGGSSSEEPAPTAPASTLTTAPTTTVPPAAGTTTDQPSVAAEPATSSVGAPMNVAPAGGPVDLGPARRVMSTAGKIVMLALGLGVLVVGIVLWRMWRQPQNEGEAASLELAQRIDAAAGGLPPIGDMMTWSKEKLCAVTAALVEFDDYAAHVRRGGGDTYIELRKRGDVNPRVLVCCSPGSAGIVGAKRLRELFGTLAAEGVETGWFVTPAGFTADAREYAASHRIVLVPSEGLHNLMREVPPVSLPRVLASE